MESHLKKNIKFLSRSIFHFFSAVALLFVFSGCMQVVPEITSTDYSVIFEYDDAKVNARLSVLALSETDVRRYDSMKVECSDSDFSWETSELAVFSDGSNQWVGNTNLVVPEGCIIPTGVYEVSLFNADGESENVRMKIDYNEEYYSLSDADVDSYAKSRGGNRQLAIYNYEKILVYFGQETSRLNSDFKIKETYKDAVYRQYIWLVPKDGVICIMKEKEIGN